MTDEQIKQNAETAYPGFEDLQAVYIEGSHSRDEEIGRMNTTIRLYANQIAQLRKEIEQLRNPWISVEERLPDYPESEYDIDNMYLVCREGGSLVFPAIFRRNGKWYIYDYMQTTEIIAPDYWMPMPDVPKNDN